MYSDIKKSKMPIIIAIIFTVLLCIALIAFAYSKSRTDLRDESIAAIKSAVEKTALQCYAVEGAFPENIEYLEENYGLMVNRDDYYIVYEAFASNMMPDVKVVQKK